MKKLSVFLLVVACLVGLVLPAAHCQDFNFKVERDTSGFVLVQGAQRTPFDTAFVSQALKTKSEEAISLQNEVAILEQLLQKRRELQAVLTERKTLAEILSQSRTCAPISSAH